MKKIILGLLVVLTLMLMIGCTNSQLQGYTPLDTQPNIYVMKDEFTDLEYYQHKNCSNFPGMNLYIVSLERGSTKMQVLTSTFEYQGNDWIFFDKIIIMNSNNDRLFIKINKLDKDTDVNSGRVYESITFALSSEQIQKIEKILNSDSVKIRLTGDYRKDYSLTELNILNLREILSFYHENLSKGIVNGNAITL